MPLPPIYFASAAEFRAWLDQHHATERELVVGFHKRATGHPSMTWPESVDEALAYGWIDGVRRRVDDERYVIRFTPRKATSTWSAVNIRRVSELQALGRMTPAGQAAFDGRDARKARLYSYERGAAALSSGEEAAFRQNAAAWADFEQRQPSYRKTVTWWVVSAKRAETRVRRLATLIEDCAAGRSIAPLRWASGPAKKRPAKRPDR